MYIYIMSMSKLIFRFLLKNFGAKPEIGAPDAQICPFHRIRSPFHATLDDLLPGLRDCCIEVILIYSPSAPINDSMELTKKI